MLNLLQIEKELTAKQNRMNFCQWRRFGSTKNFATITIFFIFIIGFRINFHFHLIFLKGRGFSPSDQFSAYLQIPWFQDELTYGI